MSNIKAIGKFLDQPILVAKFQKAVPTLLTTGAAAYTLYDASKEKDPQKRKQRALKTGITLGTTVTAALVAPKIAANITKRALPTSLNVIKKNNARLVDSFIRNSNVDDATATILNKSKKQILNLKEVNTIFNNLSKDEKGKDFLSKLIPAPENISAKDIFSEIGYLSIFGAIPVIGGITGGVIADKVTDKKNWKAKVPDKIKEGSYQYLANIFMCNVGAGIALGLMEKIGVTSKIGRAAGMTAGIIATGVLGGSKIANFISNKMIDPLFDKKSSKGLPQNNKHHDMSDHTHQIQQSNTTNLVEFHSRRYENKNEFKKEVKKDRTPEALDIGLHVDDISTVSLLSGLKWIEPALPVMYTISGYRAGIGYRN